MINELKLQFREPRYIVYGRQQPLTSERRLEILAESTV